MNYKNLIVEIKNSVAYLRLHRPPMNVMDIDTIREMDDALNVIKKNDQIFFIVFSGTGEKAFSAGVDIKDHTPDKVETMLTVFHKLFRVLSQTDKITIASVSGYCLGGGMELASICDFVIAGESAVFGQPEIKVGCYPPVAAAWLPKLVGPKRAAEICLLGETMTAAEAYRIGLINKTVPADQLQSETDSLIRKLSDLSGAVLKKTKRALQSGMSKPFTEALNEAESIYLKELVKTSDINEGIDAFLQKRKPVWQHK